MADMLNVVKSSMKRPVFVALLMVLAAAAGCKKEEQAVSRVAQSAMSAEQKAQAVSVEREKERADLARIALPTKSRYANVHEPGAWMNPFLSFDVEWINLRITRADANPSSLGEGGMLRPTAARRQELQIRQKDLVDALLALPDGAWPYGRVVAIEESPLASSKDRPAIRRRIEATIQQLNDLGVVVEEWPSR